MIPKFWRQGLRDVPDYPFRSEKILRKLKTGSGPSFYRARNRWNNPFNSLPARNSLRCNTVPAEKSGCFAVSVVGKENHVDRGV